MADQHHHESDSERLFRAVFSAAPIAQAAIGTDATFLHVNPAGCEMVGYEESELVGRAFSEVVASESVVEATEAFLALLSGDVDTVRLDVKLLRKDHTTLVAEVYAAPVSRASGDPAYFVVLAQDVTERRQVERRILQQAMNDELTELPNRAWFAERLVKAVNRLERRTGGLLGLYFIDIDGFKAVNDRFGHQVGDEAIFVAAGRLRHAVRPADTVARYAGDEFTVLCEDLTDARAAVDVADRLLHAFDRPLHLSVGPLDLKVSIGVVLTDVPMPVNVLLRDADRAMYASKQAGRARFTVRAVDRSRAGAALLRHDQVEALRLVTEDEFIDLTQEVTIDLEGHRTVSGDGGLGQS